MQSHNIPRLGRIFLSSALTIISVGIAFGADTKTTTHPDPILTGPALVQAKDLDPIPAEPSTPPAKSDSAKDKTPSSASKAAKRPPVLLKAGPKDSALEAPKDMPPKESAPKELPPAKAADQPSPLRLQIDPPAAKTETLPAEPKILTFKPDTETSSVANRLQASASTQEKTEPEKTEKTPANENILIVPPKNDSATPETEIEPIAPEDAPSAEASDDNRSKASKGGEPKPTTEEPSLEPVTDADESGPAALEAASFNGVTPGITTIEEVEKAWGSPKEMYKQNELMTQLYSIEPFDRIEVSYEKDRVVSLIVRFQKPFPAKRIAQQLDMAAVKPVLVSNDMGEILGESFPERGVLFAFEPGEEKSVPSYKVTHIILEPINAEPFILRAETELETRYERSYQDLQIALELQPENARANWLMGRAMAAMEQYEKAEAASGEAARLEPKNARYCITHAQILGQMGRLREALSESQKAIELADEQPHLKARAYCLMGDLIASGPKPDYRKAINYHGQALQIAAKAATDEHPTVRKMAKETLVDAHLGSAHDIAWGDWKDKEKAVSMWLEKATVIADDLMKNEGGSAEQLFRVETRALAACVGIRTGTDPKRWLEKAVNTGNELIDSTRDPVRKAQYQWDLGMAFYDAVQISQLRSDHVRALKYGEAAIDYLEQGHARKQSPTAAYLLGRLYFRMGAIYAIRDQNHDTAVSWFDKAVPLLKNPIPPEAFADLGRHGETFVSMGVSYWETSNRERAIELTEHGIGLMEEAVRQGSMDRSSLLIPYSNLAAMHRQVGANEDAAKYAEMAAKIKNTKTR
jgi:tetratricopeptide (TPR) repeat protein